VGRHPDRRALIANGLVPRPEWLGCFAALALLAASPAWGIGIYLSDGFSPCGFHSSVYAVDEIVYVCGEWDQPDGFCATGNVYIMIDDGRPFTVGRPLTDHMGAPNPIQSCVGAGEFFDEMIALPPLKVGRYDVVMDENQNGVFSGGAYPDYALGDGGAYAFEVLDYSLGTGIDTGAIKDQALANAFLWARAGYGLDRVFTLAIKKYKLPNRRRPGSLTLRDSLTYDDVLAIAGTLFPNRDIAHEFVVRYLDHPPTQPEFRFSVKPVSYYKTYLRRGVYQLNRAIYDQVSVQFAIHNDPPDPNFTEIVTLGDIPYSSALGPGSEEELRVEVTNLLEEQVAFGVALRRSVEKFQGAAAVPNNTWARLQNEAIAKYATLYRTSVDSTRAAMLDLRVWVDSLGAGNGGRDSVRFAALRTQVSSGGFTDAERAEMVRYGMTVEEMDSLRSAIVSIDPAAFAGISALAVIDSIRNELTRTSAALGALIASSEAMSERLSNVWIDHPTARITGPASVAEGASVMLSATTSTDPQGGALAYAWDLDADGSFDDAVSSTATTTWSQARPVIVGLEVTDGTGLRDVAYARLLITHANDGPYFLVSSPDSFFVPLDPPATQIAFSVVAEDPEDDPISYEWSVDGVPTGTTASNYLWTAIPGVHAVDVRMSDNSPLSEDGYLVWRVRVLGEQCVTPPGGMVAWWPLDELSGATAVNLGGPVPGAYNGGATHQPGNVGGAIHLETASQTVSAADHPSLDFGTGSFSIDAWVRSSTINGSVRTIVDKRGPTGIGYSLYISSARLGLQIADASGFTNYGSSTGNITDGGWHHVAATVDRAGGTTGGKLYLDGAVVATFDPTLRPGSVSNDGLLRMGQPGIGFSGEIDEVELFSRALTATEVTSIYEAGSFGKCKTWTITASAGANGSIAPSGAVPVPGGANQTFTITPATCYHVEDVIVDGASVGPVTSYTFTNVTEHHTISASFAVSTYRITASAGANGWIAPNGVVEVSCTASQTFTIGALAGYAIQNVLVDSNPVGPVTSYTFNNVTANHTISASFVASGCLTPPTGMVAWWPLDEPAGALAIQDLAGFNNQGTPQPNGMLGPPGGPVTISGKVGGAVHFDNDYVEVPHHAELDFGASSFSIEAWVKGPNPGTVQTLPIVDKLDAHPSGTSGTGYTLNLINSFPAAAQMSFWMGDGTTFPQFLSGGSTTVPLNNTTWTHIAVTVDRSSNTVRQYINGALVATHGSTMTGSVNNTLSVAMGETRLSGSIEAALAVDELALYNRALGASEVQALWAADAAGKCPPACIPPPSGMTAWWPLDEGSTSTARDMLGDTHASYVGGATHVPGKVGGAVHLANASQFVSAFNSPSLNFGAGSFSIDAWVRTSDTSTPVRTILDKRSVDTGSLLGYAVYISSGRLGMQIADASGFTNYGSLLGTLTDGVWHLVAVTVDRTAGATGGKLYVDGAVVATFNPTLRPGSVTNFGSLRIGQAYDGSSIGFNGDIDEVELLGRALSGAEVMALYQAGAEGKCKLAVVGVADTRLPEQTVLMGMANNPLRSGRTAIRFTLAREERVEIRVFDISGRLVHSIDPGLLLAGEHSIPWDGAGADGQRLQRGVYFVQVTLGSSGVQGSRRLIIIR